MLFPCSPFPCHLLLILHHFQSDTANLGLALSSRDPGQVVRVVKYNDQPRLPSWLLAATTFGCLPAFECRFVGWFLLGLFLLPCSNRFTVQVRWGGEYGKVINGQCVNR